MGFRKRVSYFFSPGQRFARKERAFYLFQIGRLKLSDPHNLLQKIQSIRKRLGKAETWENFHALQTKVNELKEDHDLHGAIADVLSDEIAVHPKYKLTPQMKREIDEVGPEMDEFLKRKFRDPDDKKK